MKLSEFIKSIAAIDAAKGLADTFKSEIGDLPDMDLKEYGARIVKADADATALADLNKTVKELDGKVKEVEPLKVKVSTYEKTLSDGLLRTAFDAKALASGVKKEALEAAFKLSNLATAKVDLEGKSVTGITQEIFDGLKGQHNFLFNPSSTTVPPIPAIPPHGGALPVFGQSGMGGRPKSAMDHLMAAQAQRASEAK